MIKDLQEMTVRIGMGLYGGYLATRLVQDGVDIQRLENGALLGFIACVILYVGCLLHKYLNRSSNET